MAKAAARFNLEAALKKARANIKKGFERKEAGEASGFETFDDGRYIFRLLGIELGPSKSGRFQATFKWKFLGGEYKGKEYLSFQGLVDDSGWLYFLADLSRLGFEYESADDITKAALADLNKQIRKEKPVVQATLRTRGEFQNLRLPEDALLDESELDEEDLDEGDGDEADEAPARGKKPAAKGKKKPAAEEDDEEESDDDESDDEEESDDESDEDADEDADDEESEDESDEEDDGDEDEEEAVAISIGSKYKVKTQKGVKVGEALEADEDTGMVRFKLDDGRIVKLAAEKIIEEVIEKKKTAKKPATKKR